MVHLMMLEQRVPICTENSTVKSASLLGAFTFRHIYKIPFIRTKIRVFCLKIVQENNESHFLLFITTEHTTKSQHRLYSFLLKSL